MTNEDFATVQIGDHLKVHELEIVVTGKVFQHGDWFVDTEYGQFNICVCEKGE
jgi:hypothetical protein